MSHPVVHFEITGPDRSALQTFYSELFGWHIQEVPEMDYGVVDTHGGEGINGGIGGSQDAAPDIRYYIEAGDLQNVLDRVTAAGGTVVMPPLEIPGVVTFAQFNDPAGNLIGLVKSDEQGGPPVSQGNGTPVRWFEALGPKPAELKDFYEKVFGWKLEKPDMGGGDFEYWTVDAPGGKGIDGGVGSSPDGNPWATVYAHVGDLKAFCERAEALGGKVIQPPTPVGETLTVAMFTDPAGNPFGLYHSTL